MSGEKELQQYQDDHDATQLHGACDSTWGSDRKTRRSMGGVALLLAGAAVYYRTNLQPTIALSSTESEFTNMADAGKAALYIWWILDELQVQQHAPTMILADNHGAIKMANAQQPTKRTRHVEMKYFACLQWVEDEFIKFDATGSSTNYADSLSKPTGATKFYQHMDVLTGRRRPSYSLMPTKYGKRLLTVNCFSACRKLTFPNIETLQTFNIYDDRL